ncbi:amino acid ABC transporter permease [Acuticoccus sp. M5D2P5]|uniref:amino acid ABC transporter permease n=1 Tax=Acuticoccus kalidii TaxID=2910977 RepID=UPI001F27FD2C|nr:amino acid ABC transporter permease [Acuticoccus kalidii]MCF3935197.1 amino acid ABC transporter permease [Acuticoccus kalidii]
MDIIIQTLPLLWRGLITTFQLALITLALVAVISVVFGIMSVSRHRWARWVTTLYVEFFRGIPLIVNLLFTYFGAPLVGLSLDPFSSAVVSLTTWGAANGAEIVRGGFAAIPRHQGESAAALAMRPWETMWYILLPQIILPVLPSFTGLFSILIQATSLASLVGAMEFLRTSQIIVERSTLMTGHSPAFVVFGFVLIVYFVICFSLNLFTAWLERTIGRRRTRRVSASLQTAETA